MSDSNSANSPTFEQTLVELEEIVAKMEQGDLPLDQALAAFERGIGLARTGQETLKNAEQKVQMLVKTSAGESLVDMDKAEDAE